MTLIIQIQMKVTVVNIIQNRMTLIIQIRMKVAVVSITSVYNSITNDAMVLGELHQQHFEKCVLILLTIPEVINSLGIKVSAA